MNWTVTSDDSVVWSVSDGASALSALSDVDIDTPVNGQGLVYNSTTGKWENSTAAGSGDVTGPSSSVADRIATFNGTSGKIIKDGGKTVVEVLNTDNHTNGTTNKVYTATEQTKLAGIESGADVTDAANVDAAGATMNTDTTLVGNGYFLDEDNMASDSATKVPSQQSVKAYADAREVAAKAYADGLVVGLWDDRGSFDASVNAYPSSGGSGTAGAILKGDIWTVSVAGTLPTAQVVEVGDVVRAVVDTPGNTQANWAITQNNIGYTAENSANKENTTLDTSTTKYPTNRLVKEQVDLKAPLASPTFTGTVTTPAIIVSSETADTIAQIDTNKNVKSLATATYPSLTELSYVKGVTSAIQTQLNAKASSTFVDAISGIIETPADGTYKLVIKCPFACTINETVTMCDSGTATATFKINTTALGGTANAVSNSEQTQAQSSANSVAAGDDIQVTISSNAACTRMSFTIKITRTI